MHQSELQTGQHISIGYACERHALFIYLLLPFVALEKREKLKSQREKEKLPCVRYCYPGSYGRSNPSMKISETVSSWYEMLQISMPCSYPILISFNFVLNDNL